MVLNKGDIVLINFNPTKGKKIGKFRPAVIISGDDENQEFETIIVIPLSTVIVEDAYPYRVFIPKREKLLKDSDACIYEIRALSKIRVKEKLAKVTKNELSLIQKALCEIIT
ncbi:type II toxin-antitoxin system PemK/MazF family toxin [Caminibacter sp.]